MPNSYEPAIVFKHSGKTNVSGRRWVNVSILICSGGSNNELSICFFKLLFLNLSPPPPTVQLVMQAIKNKEKRERRNGNNEPLKKTSCKNVQHIETISDGGNKKQKMQYYFLRPMYLLGHIAAFSNMILSQWVSLHLYQVNCEQRYWWPEKRELCFIYCMSISYS